MKNECPHRHAFRARKSRAKRKGIRWDLRYEDLGSPPDRCSCCGTLMLRGDENGGRGTAPSIDRILPAEGYTKKNVVWLCQSCNATKSDAGPAELYQIADWLWDRYKERGIPLPPTRLRPSLTNEPPRLPTSADRIARIDGKRAASLPNNHNKEQEMTGPDKAHAVLGASGAKRWMTCPGSVRLSAEIEYKDTSSEYAREGTAAHAVAEKALLNNMDPEFYVGQKFEGVKVDRDMAAAVRVYVEKVRMVARSCGTHGLQIGEDHVETQFDLSALSPPGDMFGTVDFWEFDDKTDHLWIVDYKHGRGVAVEAEENPQLMYYALGAVVATRHKPKKITIVIVQPRCAHPDGIVRDYTFDYTRLQAFTKELMDAAHATTAPDAPLVMDADACRWCPAKAHCPLQHENAVVLAQEEFSVMEPGTLPVPESLTEEELETVLDKADMVLDWLNAVKKHAKDKLQHSAPVEGWKLVWKSAHRKWIDEDEVLEMLQNIEGIDLDDFVAVVSPAQVEKRLRRYGEDLPEGLTHKKPSGYNMVRADDPRDGVVPNEGTEFPTTGAKASTTRSKT